jgi:crossover junction endodeoxyribonuclease RuvC
MKILAFDPGLERVGFAVIDRTGSKLTPLDFGLIQTPRVELPLRLRLIHEAAVELMTKHQPDHVATERLLFTKNTTTALDVSKALGAILLAVGQAGVPWCEYSPPEVKQSVVGYGRADKKQIEFMVVRLLSLPAPPKPDDVADALAIAITHALRSRLTHSPNG